MSNCVRAHADEDLHQHMAVRTMVLIYHSFISAYARSDPSPSSHKILPFSRLCNAPGARPVDLLHGKRVRFDPSDLER